MPAPTTIGVQDAIDFILHYLRSDWRMKHWNTFGNRQYDVHVHFVMQAFLAEHGVADGDQALVIHKSDAALSPAFMSAAWELCRQGVLRPGVRVSKAEPTREGSAGLGYSLTDIGEQRLKEATDHQLVPASPGRLSQMFRDSGQRFGTGFLERSQEAVAAYQALAYMACCTMCGAAAESIVLALAIGKRGAEKPILDMYAAAQGRGRVERYLLGGQPTPVRDEVLRYTMLLKYWRDSSAHGKAVRIREPEAYQSLALLLRFALFARDRWEDLTA
jgi:hypothetical protein